MMPPPVSLAAVVPSLDGAWKILVFLIMLSVLVVLHEAGHMIAARLNGVRVTDFALGFGPTLLKWTSKRSGTNYRLNLLPIGGYCGMQGLDAGRGEVEEQRALASELEATPAVMRASGLRAGATAVAEPPAVEIARAAAAGASDPTTPGADLATSFQAKPTWGRLSIVLAGPVANFILAFVIMLVAIAHLRRALREDVDQGRPRARELGRVRAPGSRRATRSSRSTAGRTPTATRS